MDRRNFFQILSASSAGVLTSGCSRKTDALIPLLVPEQEIVPGEQQWHPAVCTECGAGCGTIVRVMEGVRTIERQGQPFRQRIAAIKKIEGNPLDPVSGGRLCARGQAAVQSLYHPDRLGGPMKRTGERGKAQLTAIPWDQAMAAARQMIEKADPARVLFLTGPGFGTRSLAAERFTKAIGAPAPVVCSINDFAAERKAAEAVFGWKGLPVYDIAHARHVLSVGADFLGGWTSPVYYSRQYGHFRQGRPGIRGHLVHAESRMSLTAAAADRWLPLRPGTEPLLLAALGKMLTDAGVAKSLSANAPMGFFGGKPGELLAVCGVEERRAIELVQMWKEDGPPLVVAGASIPHSNAWQAVTASHYLNAMLGNIGKPGGVMAPSNLLPQAEGNLRDALARAQLILIDGANPAYTLPPASGVLDALKRADAVINFAGFVDDSAAWSDLILPGHHALEAEAAMMPVVAPQPSVTMSVPFVRPLHDTRPVEKTLADLSKSAAVTLQDLAGPMLPSGTPLGDATREGGIWLDAKSEAVPKVAGVELSSVPAAFDGDAGQFPLLFQAYQSIQYGDGSGANLPWLQELPDPTSSSIWGLPVEIDPKTAASLHVTNGDLVQVESPHGSLRAPAYVNPAAIPGVASMAIGDGHRHYGRYASDRGVNPISILGTDGSVVRVRLARVSGRHGWIQFAAPDREEREAAHR